MDNENKKDEPKVQADNNSIAIGGISAGGDISGNIHIGNIYQTPEDDLPLSSDEIENGLIRFAQFLPERAPVLQDSFSSIAKKLRATLGADQNSLSPALKAQREDGVNRMKLMCMEVTDISFRAMCLGQNPPPYDSRPPFLGLFAFHPKDKEFFFGREALVQKLVARIKEHPFLAVLGASGSGKSSLVMAGLIPTLEAQMSYLTPSSVPLYQLLAAKESADAKTIFVIDQFEELFTHAARHDAAECVDFIHALLDLTKTNRVVITMRADFWGEVAIYTDLKHAMQEHQELIAPMTVDELHSAMEKQAAVVGLRFDPSLSESILAEVKGEPGAMPLLQHALWELWNRRHGLWIKAEEYQAFGGVKQAIASTAEEVYASCSDFERDRVRDIFLRLTRLDESGEGRDTRRRVLIEELIPVNSDISVTIKLLNKLADARLIVKTDKDVEVAHEALIRHWSRLTNWLNEDRDNLRLREGVSESAREWENSKRDDSLLNHRGGRLELALAMSKLPRYQLNPVEQAYLNSCISLRNKGQRERERRLRWTVVASIAAAVIFLVLGGLALVKSNEAANQAKIASARELAAVANANLDLDPELSLQLAMQSNRDARTLQGEDAVRRALLPPPVMLTLHGHSGAVYSVAYSHDGKRLVTASGDETARIWDAVTGRELMVLRGHSGPVNSAAFSPDGKLVATASADKTVRLWNADSGELVRILDKHSDIVNSVAFSPNGQQLVTASKDKTARVWDVGSGSQIYVLTNDAEVRTAVFSPLGTYISTGGYDQTIKVWNAVTGQLTQSFDNSPENVNALAFSPDEQYLLVDQLYSADRWNIVNGQIVKQYNNHHTWYLTSVAFSPDGRQVVTASRDHTVVIWDAESGNYIEVLHGHSGIVYAAAFNPSGDQLATASEDQTVRIWNIAEWRKRVLFGYSGYVIEAVYNSDGSQIATTNSDGMIRIWDATTGRELKSWQYPDWLANRLQFSPDNQQLITSSDDGTWRLWDIATRQQLDQSSSIGTVVSDARFNRDGTRIITTGRDNLGVIWDAETRLPLIQLKGHKGGVWSGMFSPDGQLAVTASADDTARIWNVQTGEPLQVLSGHSDLVVKAAFSSDGKRVVTASVDGTARIWDVNSGQMLHILKEHTSQLTDAVFSPDDRYIATASYDHTVILWDANTGNEIVQLLGHNKVIYSVAFSPDGRYLLTASLDGTARIYPVHFEDVLTLAQSLLSSRKLTCAERLKYLHEQAVCPTLTLAP